jgi:hypothetical protein
MRRLLHAITTPETQPIDRPGLRGAPLVRVADGALVGWASVLHDTGGSFDRRDLLEHHEIISHLHASVDACLPARFPTWLDDDTLGQRRDQLARALERVHGRCEVAITAVWTTPDDGPAPAEGLRPGVSFLRARQRYFAGSDRRRGRAHELSVEVEKIGGKDVVQVQHTLCPSEAVALSSALLVPRASATDVIARLPRAQQDVRILVNGPWPPYTFAAIGGMREE